MNSYNVTVCQVFPTERFIKSYSAKSQEELDDLLDELDMKWDDEFYKIDITLIEDYA